MDTNTRSTSYDPHILKRICSADDPRDAALAEDPWELRGLIQEVGGGTALARLIGYTGSHQRFRELQYFVERFCEAADNHAEPSDATERVWQRQAGRLKAENEILQNWRQVITEAIERGRMAFTPTRAPKPHTGPRDERIAILNIGDVHIGERVTIADTGGVAEYNFPVFLRRLEQLKERLQSVIDEQRLAYPVPTCILHFLGDIGTGEGVFPKQLARLDLFLEDQITQGAWHLAEFVRWVAGLFPQVRVYCVPGNHTPKELTINTDRLMYHVMALLLKRQANVQWYTSASHYLGYRLGPQDGLCEWSGSVREWAHLITHGHQAKRYQSVPYYALDRLVQRYTDMTDRLWDRMYCAHSHEDASVGRWQVNGCWPGGTEYSTERMQGASRPSQHLDFWHPEHGVTSAHELYLADRMDLRECGDNGIYTPLSEPMAEVT